MKEFATALNHHSSQQVTDQMLVDRLFAMDLRLVEIKNIALRFMNARDNKQLMSYINKSKNPNRRGSGGTQFFNPVRQSRELGQIFAVLCNQVRAIERSLGEQFDPESAMCQDTRLTLLATMIVWENFGGMDFVQRKKVRAIDLFNVVLFERQGDWKVKNCAICFSVYAEHDETVAGCQVCSVTARKVTERMSRRAYA